MKNKTLLIVIAIVVVVGLWAFSGYNGMVDKQEEATTALSKVEAQDRRRADMMPQLVKIVKAYAKHEKETFDAVTKARNAATQIHLDADNLTPEKMKQFEMAQNQVAQAFCITHRCMSSPSCPASPQLMMRSALAKSCSMTLNCSSTPSLRRMPNRSGTMGRAASDQAFQ